jgi:hypothetical protein
VTPNGCFVVKWFFCLHKHDGLFDEDDPVNTVLIKDNNIQIQAELSQLTLGQWFLKAFFKFAQKMVLWLIKVGHSMVLVTMLMTKFMLAQDIMFADTFLGEEEEGQLSPASGGHVFNGKPIL